MSCPECGWPEPHGRCARCGCFIRPVYFRSRGDEFRDDEETDDFADEEEAETEAPQPAKAAAPFQTP